MGTRTEILDVALDAAGNQIVGGLGVSLTMPGEASDYVQPRSTLAADWVGIRYMAVDYDSGSDTAVGYSDVSMAAAGAVALKTIEELLTRIPKNGQGQTLVIAIKDRSGGATYKKKDGTTDDVLSLLGIDGYTHFLVRGTGTVASAGATAFANDSADKICCGARLFAGTNAGGYNPVAPITVSSFDVQLAGGGAPGLAAEPGLVGKRIRFDSATTTVALRNACSMIWQNDTDTITVSDNLPATPVAADVFYIEEPNVAVDSISVVSSNPNHAQPPPGFAQMGIHVAGFRSVAATAQAPVAFSGSAIVVGSFLDVASSASTSFRGNNFFDIRIQRSYVDEAGTAVVTGVGIRAPNLVTTSNGLRHFLTSSALVSTFGRPQVLGVVQYSVGGGCYFQIGVLVQTGGSGGVGDAAIYAGLIGRGATATQQRMRVLAPFSGTGISISMVQSCAVVGVDVTGMGGSSLIQFRAISAALNVADVVGSTGNTGMGLDLSGSRDCGIVMGVVGGANTFTGAAGRDILGAGGAATTGPFYVHADYARCDLRDANGNHVQGTGRTSIGPTVVITNDGNADIGQYKIVRATGSGVVRAAIASAAATAIAQGVSQSAFTSAGPQLSMLVNGGGSWIQFDAGPTAGNIAYLSTATAGNAQDGAPALSGTNQKLRLGRILRVSGTLGYVHFSPETLAVLADGAA